MDLEQFLVMQPQKDPSKPVRLLLKPRSRPKPPQGKIVTGLFVYSSLKNAQLAQDRLLIYFACKVSPKGITRASMAVLRAASEA